MGALEGMAAGAAPLDSAEALRLLQEFATDSQATAGRSIVTGADAADIHARFEAFSADARRAGEAIPAGDPLQPHLLRLRADCRSCHDLYAN